MTDYTDSPEGQNALAQAEEDARIEAETAVAEAPPQDEMDIVPIKTLLAQADGEHDRNDATISGADCPKCNAERRLHGARSIIERLIAEIERLRAASCAPRTICATCQGRHWIMKSESRDLGNGVGAGGAWNEPCPDCTIVPPSPAEKAPTR